MTAGTRQLVRRTTALVRVVTVAPVAGRKVMRRPTCTGRRHASTRTGRDNTQVRATLPAAATFRLAVHARTVVLPMELVPTTDTAPADGAVSTT